MCRHAVDVKDNEIKRLLENQKILEKQVADLNVIFEKHQRLEKKDNKDLQKKKDAVESNAFMEDGYDKAKRAALKKNPMSTELLLDARNVEEYAQSIKLMEEAQADRDAYVLKLLKVI